jgi:hypothetical protein
MVRIGGHGRCHSLLGHLHACDHGGRSGYARYDGHMRDLPLATTQVCSAGYTKLLVGSIL